MAPESIRQVGPYEVLSTLGQGGMGTVYLARDTRLGRQVALKFLTGRAVSTDADAQAQLLREARAVSALNHPNICQVYDVGGEGSAAWVAMEYIEGDSLAARLRAHGPLPAAEVAALGKQIAEGLAHAHHRGILHRDLKGANIVCDRDGRPKILDFGIARRLLADISNEVTRSTEVSSPGVEGTLAYMAPEAVRGQPQDERSDLWSLGVVFYELLTGRLPFQGRNTLDLAAAIITASPPSIPDSVPPALATVVRRLLSKEPSGRYGTAAEVGAALSLPVGGEVVQPAPRRPLWTTSRVAAGVILVAVATFAAWQWRSNQPLQLSEQKLVSTDTSTAQSPAYSPDGSTLAFAAPDTSGVPQIWMKKVAGSPSLQVTRGFAAAGRPRWMSTDRILFALAGQGIWTVAVGGTPTRLIERGSNPNISQDGRFIVFEDQRAIWVAAADGTGVRKVEGPAPLFYPIPRTPSLSPDGSTIAYFQTELGPNGDIWTIPSAGGTPTRLTSDLREGGSPVWTADGRTVVFSSARNGSRTLWQIPASGGEPTPLTVGAGEDDQPDIAADGRQLAYSNVRHRWELRVRNVATGVERTLMQRGIELLFPMFSPDGGRIALFGRTDYAVAILSIGLNGEELRLLTTGRELNHMPRWSADGQEVYFYQAAPTRTLRKVSVLGGPSTEFRPWQWETHGASHFDPSGRFITYVKQISPGQQERTVIHEVATGQERVWAEPHTHVGGWSPDGLSIVGSQHGTGGDFWVTVCVAADGTCRRLTQGRMPRWSAWDGRIYFVRPTPEAATDLWSIAADGTDERRVFTLGTFRAIDVFFDVSKQGEVVWAPFYPGERQVWSATVR